MLELAFLIGLMWVVARGADSASTAWRSHQAAVRKRTPQAHQRRANRQAFAGFWLREIFTLGHNTRQGMAAGWHDHRTAWGEARVTAAKRKADHGEQRVAWQAIIAAHLHRLEIAAQKYREGPSMSDQLRAILLALQKRLGDQQPDPAANGHRPPPDDKRKQPDKRREPEPPEPEDHEDEQPQPEGEPPVSGSGADINYEQTLATCDEATAAAEEGVNSEALAKVTALVDGLGAMLRDDADSCGQAADAAQEAAAVKEHAGALIEAIAALKAGVESKYGPQQEALDAAGVGQPEVGYLEH